MMMTMNFYSSHNFYCRIFYNYSISLLLIVDDIRLNPIHKTFLLYIYRINIVYREVGAISVFLGALKHLSRE